MNQKSMAAFLVGGLAFMGGAGALSFGWMSSSSSASTAAAVAKPQPEVVSGMRTASALGTVPPSNKANATGGKATKVSVSPARLSPSTTVAPSTTTAVKNVVISKAATVPAASIPVMAVAPLAPIIYTVKSGDNLSSIAWWFQVHGYGAIYNANVAVVGANPSLIFPGQRITIVGGVLSMGA